MTRFNIDRDTSMLYRGVVVGVFLLAIIFGPDLRGMLGANTGSVGMEARLQRVELQNASHAPMQGDLDRHTDAIANLQTVSAQLLTRVEALSKMIDNMQQREYDRLRGEYDGRNDNL